MDRCLVNSLFISWLTEWKNEAAEKGLKMQYIYAKALRSIKKYPLTLTSGLECKILEGFGDKLCSQIEERLTKEFQEAGAGLSIAEFVKSFDSTKMVFTKVKPKSCSTPKVLINKRPKEASTVNLKPYVPSKNSGAYALILTLAKHHESHNGEAIMTKNDLMEAAQPLSDTSFKIPQPGSRYTAWSSMGTLLKKGLVIREGCPAKYVITNEGLAVAKKFNDALGNIEGDVPHLTSDLKNDYLNSCVGYNNDEDEDDDVIIIQENSTTPPEPTLTPVVSSLPTPPSSASSSSLPTSSSHESISRSLTLPPSNSQTSQSISGKKPSWFMYMTGDGRVTSMKDRAVVSVDETTQEIRFLIKCKYQDLLLSGMNYSIDYSRLCKEADDIYAFIGDADAPDALVTNHEDSPASASTTSKSFNDVQMTAKSTSSHKSSSPLPPPPSLPSNLQKTSIASTSAPIVKPSGKAISKRKSDSDQSTGMTKKKPKFEKAVSENFSAKNKNSKTFQPHTSSLLDAVKNITIPESALNSKLTEDNKIRSASEPKELLRVSPDQADVTFKPGSFEVILLVDNRESVGPTASSEEMLYAELRKNNVLFEVRQLQLGDFIWVARSCADNKSVELVLDYIVERKRMDDLASSIIDGRFREQKFRLSNCGLSNVVYLIEEVGKSTHHFSIPEASLNQAIINTQVVDEFMVKRTRNPKELTNYLVLMTRFLQGQYLKKTLLGFQRFFHSTGSSKELMAVNLPQVCLMDYEVFSEHSMKSKSLTVTEMFVKQLTQISGVTGEKAFSIVQKYPTPLLLYEAYKKCHSDEERHKLLADIKCGPLKRNFGPALSKAISSVYS